jgi:site-specific recombinase XerD
MRNAAMIAVLWRCGLRVGEALDLVPADLCFDERVVRVRRGKGGKARVVGLDAGTAALVERWLQAREALTVGNPGNVAAFCAAVS